MAFPLFSFDQDDNPLEYYKLVLGESDGDFEATEAPAEWKDESAVILCQKTYISFLGDKRRKGTKTKGITRKRVLIQDQTALDDYSEYHYQSSDAVGLFIIKPDGKKEEIDISKAVRVESDVPRSYASSYQSSDYYKIAIPNLAIGDILDYFKVFTEKYTSDVNIIAPISSFYPIKYQELIFDVEKRWKFRYNSFNGAPSFIQKMEGGLDGKGRKSIGVSRFTIKDQMRSTYKDVMWDYENLTEPIIKIMASPIPKGVKVDKKKKQVQRGTTPEILYEGLSDLEKLPAIINRFSNNLSGIYTLGRYVKKMENTAGETDEQVAAKIYYGLRLGFLHQMTNYSEEVVSTKKKAARVRQNRIYKKLLSPSQYYKMSDAYFAYYFKEQLKSNGITSEYVVAVPRLYGNLESVVLDRELTYGIYIPSVDKYYWPFDNYLSAGEMDYRLFNVPVYRSSSNNHYNKNDKVTHNSSASDNNYINSISLKINEENYSMMFDHEVKFQGAYKQLYYGLILYQENYIAEDDDRIARNEIKTEQNRLEAKINKKNKISEEDMAEIKSELSEKKKENIKDWIRQDHDTEEIKEFKVLSNGRFGDDLKAQIKYDAKDYIKKAGPNLIFDIGKMIGSQIELDEDDIKERTKDAQINFAKTIENNITLELPDGYKAEGIDNLNMSVENEFGAFISEAKMEGNKLKVSTMKIYKNQTVPAKEWSKMVEMLELAFKFSQQKIILKK